MAGIGTNSIHAADKLSRVSDVIQPINVTTTFRYSEDPSTYVKAVDRTYDSIIGDHYYSRLTHPNSEAAEEIIGTITNAKAVAYSSGLASIFAAFTYFNPKTVAIGLGYHGTHGITKIFSKLTNLKQITLQDVAKDPTQLSTGDVIYVETPVNPDGEVFDLEFFGNIAHSRGALLLVDATFAPPPLSDPFKQGADLVIHSATKFFGGHSDLLAGILLTKSDKVKNDLVYERLLLGSTIANLESFLLIRSLKTFELRIRRQSSNATKIVEYLSANQHKFPKLVKISHGSLQKDAFIAKQMPNGHSPIFCIELETEELARSFPSKLEYFHHATSLGGVESLIEWRPISDSTCPVTLLRVSVGVENVEDLIADITKALESIH
ncbi:uncharacterized trans-sulfuration enzyme [[Candida] railenensis]|uniref:Uncharacterized trans-sulfuration enzyme n=1 Tax=[Candida] railenensis TaxID=45579 RepID=A0A9P0QVN6_9ASCO|nr:uncharacterized trans-sulfuration enzyme [[Candida] railenensis]